MIPPAPEEPSANVLCWRYYHRLASNPKAADRHVDRFLAVQVRAERAQKRAALLAARKRVAPRTPRPPA